MARPGRCRLPREAAHGVAECFYVEPLLQHGIGDASRPWPPPPPKTARSPSTWPKPADDDYQDGPRRGGSRTKMVQRTGTGIAGREHVVLASADSDAFTSLRRRSTSRRDRYRMGRELRRQVPRSSLGNGPRHADRPDPVQLIIESHERPARLADPGPGRADDRHAVRVPARRRGRDGGGRCPAAVHRHHPGDLR